MGRGPDKQPRALPFTAPQFVTELEAVGMGLSTEEVRKLESIGSITPRNGSPAPVYRYLDVERSIKANGGEVDNAILKG